ncbi:hypothetical protein CPAST_c19220 [Clostridium pasteurianum DSM 525 = ATCC 6013]|uniref:Uncharacterized protein n=1 Tax=Clostridium pasteurianum DSM 525 = ATCC 6013 TaxID=1262449 RepID=A0A0H3J4R8_CLOPA|nr:hypothetical protein [Clostridium pasteurianum]AJA47992.1 hypothetical protein CPAST_c19220 [Clostridium pasteurianum DSM 525 = ATCC 6013]AJA51980.1 hypothetical protein CLPA_c19220 [Clostridium pasteurianum DSM 525 = ATCC 6013]AOZ75277.1 hypothetical protein AQ983_09335 [Clostridium pasteurianum DSM 525 = ATCC 6013]AOZ79072.1 hypothetical protein AQ984_09325 [Clostridium pasteurianum]ELP59895.1 hypothetical protein F502_08518 [Clostridium pasteurianum DSM 525 = ATCC 6013]
MKGKIIKENYIAKKNTNFGDIGEYAFTYEGVDYHVGDVVFIMDTSFVRRTTLVVKFRDNYYIHGYPGNLNGIIHKDYILQLKIVKKYTELSNNRYIDGFTVKIGDTEEIQKINDTDLEKNLKLEDKLSLVELSINLLLSNYKHLNKLEKNKLYDLSKKYSILYELLKDKEDMKLVDKFRKKTIK